LGGVLQVPLNTLSRTTFSRKFLSALFGGSPQDTYPTPSAKKFSHGYNLLCVNYDFNPNIPQVPGQNGLCNCGGLANRRGERWHVFTWQSANNWLFVGVYELRTVPILSATEWILQPENVRALVLGLA
jgi:hypothetical protein